MVLKHGLAWAARSAVGVGSGGSGGSEERGGSKIALNSNKKNEPENIRGVLGWIRFTLSDHVCHSIKTVRAIHEIFLTLLGLESSSGIGFDFDHSGGFGGPSSRSQSEQESLVLSVTTCGSTQDSIASLSLWSELCTSYPVFVEQHELIVTQLLLTVRDDLDSAVQRRGCSVDWWAAVMRMLCALSGCVTSFNAPLLFDQVLKIMALCPAGEGGSLAAYCGDSTLASIVEQIQLPGTQTTTTTLSNQTTSKGSTTEIEVVVMTAVPPISHSAVLECTRRAGVLTRVALSRIVPEMLLLDYDSRVRVTALQAMQDKSDDAVLQTSGAIFGACSQVNGKRTRHEHDGSDSLNMNEMELALACAPLVSRLAVIDTTGACVVLAVEKLLWAAKITKEVSNLGQADQVVLDALARIPLQLKSEQLVRFCTSEAGHKWLSRLTRFPTWERAVGNLVNEGKLIKFGRRNRSGSGSSKSGSSSSKSSKSSKSNAHKEAGMYGPEGEHSFEVPEGRFAKALPVCTVITVEDVQNMTTVGTCSEPNKDNKSTTERFKQSVVLGGIVVPNQNNPTITALSFQQHDSQDYVHLSTDQASLRSHLSQAAQAHQEGRWAGLNQARQEGKWDWTRSSVSGENVMPVANGFEVIPTTSSSSSMNAFDFSRLPSAPTHTPRMGASKMAEDANSEQNLRQPLLS